LTDKERLENVAALGIDGQGNVLIKGEDFHWLMEQAERVQELEKHLKLYDFWYRTAYEQNKRYREALNSVITLWVASTDATDDTWLAHEMSETARKALEGEE